MKIMLAPRGYFKTRALLETSERTGYTIVCATNEMARNLGYAAEREGLNIPDPLPFHKILQSGLGITKLLIDNIDMCLQVLIPYEIEVVTLTGSE